MTKHEAPTGREHGANAPQPVRTLRDWLDHLAAGDRLAVLKPNIALKFELAAYAKRLDGQRATLFPKPGGHAIPVVSGLISDRDWMAEAMAVEPAAMLAHFQNAASNPTPWQEVKSAPAQETVHRARLDLAQILPLPTHNEHDPPLPAHRAEPPRRPGAAATYVCVPPHGRGGGPAARRRDRDRRRSADAAGVAGDRADRPR
jgi:2,5-furandicarboxylate decarboxylase 1